MSTAREIRVGTIRPSQLMWSYGVGAMVDLPRLSVMIEGLDHWKSPNARMISEERLLAAVRRELGPQVAELREPPLPEEEPYKAPETDPVHTIGVPVGVFPTWLRCPRCGLLSDAGSGVFTFKGSNKRPDTAGYVHQGCPKQGRGRAPGCVPARFVVACEAGHVDDFPWREFVHRGTTNCTGTLRFYEKGSSLETANLFVACDNGLDFSSSDDGDGVTHPAASGGCGVRPRSLVDAFGARGKTSLPVCRGRHPHLRQTSGSCGRELRTILLGSSNSWFPKAISALSIPSGETELERAIERKSGEFFKVDSLAEIAMLRKFNQLGGATKFSDEQIWVAIQKLRSGNGEEDAADMKPAEWKVLTDPEKAPSSLDFQVRSGGVPRGFEGRLLDTVLVERIREVNALVGFTRLEAPEDLLAGNEELDYAPLSSNAPAWVPANEVRGEGILVRFDPDALSAWEARDDVIARMAALEKANLHWRAARRLGTGRGYPGHRHVLIHTFSHLLMRELSLECGYSAASIRERVYASAPDNEPMAGVLIYTAAPDSEGTLGGLVRLGEPETLGRLIRQALEHAELCASDPLCSEHDPVPDRSLHGAACHACAFVPETSCEFGNRFLDRAAVVDTLTVSGPAFFRG